MIDWYKEIEAVHIDGRVMDVSLVGYEPCSDGEMTRRIVPALEDGNVNWFNEDGSHRLGNWTIRNIIAVTTPTPTPDERAVSPELVERMRKLAYAVSQCHYADDESNGHGIGSVFIKEARAIVAALEPVDVDLVEARNVAIGQLESRDQSETFLRRISEGDCDHYPEVRIAKAAIKRGRQLQRDSVTGVTIGTREQFEKDCI